GQTLHESATADPLALVQENHDRLDSRAHPPPAYERRLSSVRTPHNAPPHRRGLCDAQRAAAGISGEKILRSRASSKSVVRAAAQAGMLVGRQGPFGARKVTAFI